MGVGRIEGAMRAGVLVWCAWTAVAVQAAGSASEPPVAQADFRGQAASPASRLVARFAAEQGDAQGRPFVIVDKRQAQVFVFDTRARLVGAAPALLGLARGDDAAPDIGRYVPAAIPPALRTTPAGRFESRPGRNLQGEAVVWFDYDAALAIHRLRPAPATERRPQRLATSTPDDNRISLGCVVVAGDFFDAVVAPVLGHRRGVVYVLPEQQDAADWLQVTQAAAGL